MKLFIVFTLSTLLLFASIKKFFQSINTHMQRCEQEFVEEVSIRTDIIDTWSRSQLLNQWRRFSRKHTKYAAQISKVVWLLTVISIDDYSARHNSINLTNDTTTSNNASNIIHWKHLWAINFAAVTEEVEVQEAGEKTESSEEFLGDTPSNKFKYYCYWIIQSSLVVSIDDVSAQQNSTNETNATTPTNIRGRTFIVCWTKQ